MAPEFKSAFDALASRATRTYRVPFRICLALCVPLFFVLWVSINFTAASLATLVALLHASTLGRQFGLVRAEQLHGQEYAQLLNDWSAGSGKSRQKLLKQVKKQHGWLAAAFEPGPGHGAPPQRPIEDCGTPP